MTHSSRNVVDEVINRLYDDGRVLYDLNGGAHTVDGEPCWSQEGCFAIEWDDREILSKDDEREISEKAYCAVLAHAWSDLMQFGPVVMSNVTVRLVPGLDGKAEWNFTWRKTYMDVSEKGKHKTKAGWRCIIL